MKRRYRYFIGRPSWHQSRAGHSCAGTMICDHTDAEQAAFVANYKARGESITWTTEPTTAPAR
jgi:hypothetical protein